MGKKRRPGSSLNVQNDTDIETHFDVLKAQQYLERFGYLGPGYQPSVMDEKTHKALETFQQRFGLHVTGAPNPETANLLEEPRCGFPDTRPDFVAASLDEPPFQEGCKYPATTPLSYAIVQFSQQPTMSEEKARPVIRSAFKEWQRFIKRDFVEDGGNPTLTIKWLNVDGPGSILALAFPPPRCGGESAGQCHFDEEDMWDVALHDQFFAVRPVAIHEFGHLLGLGHIDLINGIPVTSVMNARFDKRVDKIPDDDPAIPIIQQMYGPRSRRMTISGSVSPRRRPPIRQPRSQRRAKRVI